MSDTMTTDQTPNTDNQPPARQSAIASVTAEPSHSPVPTGYLPPEEELSLIDIIATLWRRKVTIILWTGLAACIIAIGMGMTIAQASKRTVTKQEFKLNFQGVEKGEYPNGMPFSMNEIVTPNILNKVYEANKLDQFFDGPEAFRDAIAVSKSDKGLKFLEDKYLALLGDKKLSPEERQKLQEEYSAQRDKLMAHANYIIMFQDEANKVPKETQTKVLSDILKDWAVFTETRKGVYLYQIPLLTPDIFQVADNEEYMVQLDMLRRVVQEAREYASKIAALPGANLVKSSKGSSMAVLRFRLEELDNQRLQPLSGLIRSARLYKDEAIVNLYLKERIYRLNMELEQQKGSKALLQDSLDGYIESDHKKKLTTSQQPSVGLAAHVIPQLGDSFFDRIIAMSTESQDVKYRQEITQEVVDKGEQVLKTQSEITYYQDLLPDGKKSPLLKAQKDKFLAAFNLKYQSSKNEARGILMEMNDIYTLISKQNLRPEQSFFTSIGSPQQQTLSTLQVKKLAVIGLALLIVACGAVSFLCLIHEQIRKK